MRRRASGILLHITSLPSAYGIGDMGPWAYRFADFLFQTGQSFWQVLPLNPTSPSSGDSPYHSVSAFAGNPLLISPALLVKDGLLTLAELDPPPCFPKERVHFRSVIAYKGKLFKRAYLRFKAKADRDEFENFCRQNADWLDDFVLFNAIKSCFRKRSWSEWPRLLRDRKSVAVQIALKKLDRFVERGKFLQYIFFKQWKRLKVYCNQRGIQILGDIPIYVNYESSDLWANPELFKLDKEKKPVAVAGVPPDYFSATGQLWGHPLYRWNKLKATGYRWWIGRIKRNLSLFDALRIDHFRGFVAYWEIPAGEKTAINGHWVKAPGADFFKHLLKRFHCLPIIAEDLGTITPEVKEIMHRFQFPGMRLLLFAFGEDFPSSSYLPHNLEKNCVVYTGTHDNNTVKGWFEKEATVHERSRLFRYLGRRVPINELHWEMIRLAMMSPARLAIFPMQDILGLGDESRMNRPAKTEGNWKWRLLPGQLTPTLAGNLREMTEIYERV
ncbi:MAG TPA: 4-alpha-glucanotransferase [Desulfobacterales bacterium]|nr:4-alpha-glucanotransferase [Desulfobacterales bacterium]